MEEFNIINVMGCYGIGCRYCFSDQIVSDEIGITQFEYQTHLISLGGFYFAGNVLFKTKEEVESVLSDYIEPLLVMHKLVRGG